MLVIEPLLTTVLVSLPALTNSALVTCDDYHGYTYHGYTYHGYWLPVMVTKVTLIMVSVTVIALVKLIMVTVTVH